MPSFLEQIVKEIYMVGIATMGKFSPCCGNRAGGGGAPPYRPYNDEAPKPLVLVKRVEVKTLDISDTMIKRITVKLKDDI
jgi:hypothetical protein